MKLRACIALVALTGLAVVGAPAAAAGVEPVDITGGSPGLQLRDVGEHALPGGAIGALPGSGRALRIVGGTRTVRGAYPFITPLLAADTDGAGAQYCGGSLIAPGWVLTAAHCVVFDDPFVERGETIDVAPGAYDLRELSAGDRVRVAQVVANPQFGLRRIYPDVALLRLTRTLDGAPVVPLIQPAEDGLAVPGTVATVAGWGVTDSEARSGPAIMREVSLPIIPDATCGAPNRHGSFFKPALMLCAGDLAADGRDSCFGDSGGPLVVQSAVPGEWRQVGIVSFGSNRCGDRRFPGVYTDIAGVRDWIASVLASPGGAPNAPSIVARRTPRPTTLDLKWSWAGDAAGIAAFRVTVANGPKVDVLAGRRSAHLLGLRPGRATRVVLSAIGVDGSKSVVRSAVVRTPRERKRPVPTVVRARVTRGGVWEFAYRVRDDSWETREKIFFKRGDGEIWYLNGGFGERKPGRLYGGVVGGLPPRSFNWRVCVRATDRAGKSGEACRRATVR